MITKRLINGSVVSLHINLHSFKYKFPPHLSYLECYTKGWDSSPSLAIKTMKIKLKRGGCVVCCWWPEVVNVSFWWGLDVWFCSILKEKKSWQFYRECFFCLILHLPLSLQATLWSRMSLHLLRTSPTGPHPERPHVQVRDPNTHSELILVCHI